MKRYRVEIFNHDYDLVAHAVASDVDVRYDYLTLDDTVIVVPSEIIVTRMDYIRLKADSEAVYTGVVTDYEYADGTTTLKCQPLMMLMDVQVYLDRRTLRNTALEQIIATKLSSVYANSDAYQKLTGFQTTVAGATVGTSIMGSDDLVNLYDVAQEALRKYSIICFWRLDVSGKTITCDVRHVTGAATKLNMALALDYHIQIQSISTSYNKMKYYNGDNPAQSITYYMHPDGTVDTSNTNRITPVVYCERIETGQELDGVTMTWQEVALGNAKSTMVNSSHDNEITVTMRSDSKLVPIGSIGDTYQLIDRGGVVYTSILTGYRSDDTTVVTLLFGMIRTELTAILRMEKRK